VSLGDFENPRRVFEESVVAVDSRT
jgi:hypothetical protein